MAEIDRTAFASAVREQLSARGLSFGDAVAGWPELDKAMLSRACTEKRLSAANLLLVCAVFELDPYRFLKRDKGRRVHLRDIAKSLSEQAVTQGDKRETRSTRQARKVRRA
ncbi:hypothetical protein [Chelativorans sp. YIM 93263]|uniref:hypothetical protein n=1 Tax=Chelativorans sp. YIM 93263 TaxID=2906648 RepID=UPI0023785550|nr:hypothetical protein [Chelativorans sp. YIM 93263]